MIKVTRELHCPKPKAPSKKYDEGVLQGALLNPEKRGTLTGILQIE